MNAAHDHIYWRMRWKEEMKRAKNWFDIVPISFYIATKLCCFFALLLYSPFPLHISTVLRCQQFSLSFSFQCKQNCVNYSMLGLQMQLSPHSMLFFLQSNGSQNVCNCFNILTLYKNICSIWLIFWRCRIFPLKLYSQPQLKPRKQQNKKITQSSTNTLLWNLKKKNLFVEAIDTVHSFLNKISDLWYRRQDFYHKRTVCMYMWVYDTWDS